MDIFLHQLGLPLLNCLLFDKYSLVPLKTIFSSEHIPLPQNQPLQDDRNKPYSDLFWGVISCLVAAPPLALSHTFLRFE